MIAKRGMCFDAVDLHLHFFKPYMFIGAFATCSMNDLGFVMQQSMIASIFSISISISMHKSQ